LIFAGELLEDEKTISHYKIGDYNLPTLHLVLRLSGTPIILVKTMTGKIITLLIELDINIKSLKTKVYEMEGIPPDQFGKHKLIFAGKLLEDDKNLNDYNIQE
jgi:hypothetical protein